MVSGVKYLVVVASRDCFEKVSPGPDQTANPRFAQGQSDIRKTLGGGRLTHGRARYRIAHRRRGALDALVRVSECFQEEIMGGNGNGKKTLVIRNGTLIDGASNAASENDAIVVVGNRIRSVGAVPGDLHLEDRENVEVIDAAGRWIMPGLIDAHCHLSFGHPPIKGISKITDVGPEFRTLRAAENAMKTLRSGVTSISVPGGTWFVDVALRDAINAGFIEGPRIYCAGQFINTYGSIADSEPSWVGTPEHAIAILCKTTDEMVTEARRQLKHGVNFIKIADSSWGDTQVLSRNDMEAIADEAHRRNAHVTIHSRGSGSTRDAALAGIDCIVHADFATEADLDAVAQAGARVMPSETFNFVAIEKGVEWNRDPSEIDSLKYVVEKGAKVLERERALGIKVLSGTDTGNTHMMKYGAYHANELGVLVTCGGYTPMEAIQIGTRGNAWSVGLEGEVGVIGAGKLADIIILDADPLADISILEGGRSLTHVIKDGETIDLSAREDETS